MIAHLEGTIISRSEKSVVVDVQGVGYEVFTVPIFLERARVGEQVKFFTHHQVREDAAELFGFTKPEELDFFKKLIGVSGIGPKSALTIMSLTTVAELQKSIVEEDPSLLTKVSGIGTKTAERLIVELKNKLTTTSLGDSSAGASPEGDGQVIDGLVGLGYSVRDAREAVRAVDRTVTGASSRPA